ncbi:MAG: hypothetical protein IJB16_06425 [Clostridia bacterium]|nr:hypothetical protein [Clostridia bacterium]
MKKILCFVLSALILVSSVSVAMAAENDDTLKFAVASDLHYNVPEVELTACGEIDD